MSINRNFLMMMLLLVPMVTWSQSYLGDGINDNIQFSSPSITFQGGQSFTLEFWIKPAVPIPVPTSGGHKIIQGWLAAQYNPVVIEDCDYAGAQGGSSAAGYITFGHLVTNDNWMLKRTLLETNTLLPKQTWTHFAVVRSSPGGIQDYNIYINGTLANDKLYSGAPYLNRRKPDLFADGTVTFLCNRDANNGAINAQIDEVKLWSVARSTEQIKDDMYSRNEQQAGLIMYKKVNVIGEGNFADKSLQGARLLKDSASGGLLVKDNAPIRANDD